MRDPHQGRPARRLLAALELAAAALAGGGSVVPGTRHEHGSTGSDFAVSRA